MWLSPCLAKITQASLAPSVLSPTCSSSRPLGISCAFLLGTGGFAPESGHKSLFSWAWHRRNAMGRPQQGRLRTGKALNPPGEACLLPRQGRGIRRHSIFVHADVLTRERCWGVPIRVAQSNSRSHFLLRVSIFSFGMWYIYGKARAGGQMLPPCALAFIITRRRNDGQQDTGDHLE